MREALRLRLRKIGNLLPTAKSGVTGVTAPMRLTDNTTLHRWLHRLDLQKNEQHQRGNTVAPCITEKIEERQNRNTMGGVTALKFDVLRDAGLLTCDPEDWTAYFDERAGTIEYDGHLDRAEAERRALAETIATLGPRPLIHCDNASKEGTYRINLKPNRPLNCVNPGIKVKQRHSKIVVVTNVK